MKRSFSRACLTTLAAVCLAAFAETQAHAQTVISAYSFDNYSGTGTPTQSSGAGNATFSNNFINSSDVTSVAGETNAGKDNALRLNTGSTGGSGTAPEEGKYIEFSFDATNFSNIQFQYDTQKSSSGFTTQQVFYSTNGGTTFTNVLSAYETTSPAMASGSAGQAATISSTAGKITPPTAPNNSTNNGNGYATIYGNLSSITALNNNSMDILKIVFTGSSNSSSTTANDRIDNFSISSAPEPSGFVVLFLGAGALGLAVIRRRRAVVAAL